MHICETSSGAGGFGEVVSARNRLDGLVYAIKIVKLKNNRPKTKTEILKEVTTLARFNHPNIVRYFNVCCSRGRTEAYNTSYSQDG